MLNKELLGSYLSQLSKDIIAQMLQLYIGQSEQYLADIESAAQQQNQELWQQNCHKMKGAASSVGFLKLQQRLAELEHQSMDCTVLQELSELNSKSISEFELWLTTC